MIASGALTPSDCTTKTSCSRAFSLICTKISSFRNLKTSASPSGMPSSRQMSRANAAWALPV